MADSKFCIVCGMPLNSAEDYPQGADPATCEHCKYCGTKDGLHPYEKLVVGMAGYIKRAKKVSDEEAARLGKEAVDNSVAVKTGKLVVK